MYRTPSPLRYTTCSSTAPIDYRTFVTLWHLLRDFHPRVYRQLAWIVLYELLKLAPAAVLAVVIDTLVSFDPSEIVFLASLVAALLGISTLVSLLDIHIIYESSMIDFECERVLLRTVSEKLMRLSIGYHEGRNTGRTVYILHRGVGQLGDLIFIAGRELIPTFTQLLLTTIVLLWVGWLPGLVFMSFLPFFLLFIHRYGKRVQPLRRLYHERIETAAGLMGERVMNVRTVQDMGVEAREITTYDGILREFVLFGSKRLSFMQRSFFARDSIMNLARVAVMGTGIWMVYTQTMTPGVLVFFITLTEKALLALFRITNVYDRAADSAEGVARLAEVLAEPETIIESPLPTPVNTLKGDICFQNVTFTYGAGRNILSDLSFRVEPKTMLAVIGRSGAGKSTIVKLLFRHYDVTSGAILVDGVNIRDYELQPYRRSLALVPQEIDIFNATVRENIAFGRPDASQREIEDVASIAEAHHFISTLPAGYDTLVGERGVKLSGGQRQRIGIARALLMKPKILIFDEATSSLDTESEQLIQKAMERIAHDFTMIVIAHRLSTIEHADQVMVLEDGKIAEIGTHEDLLKHRGVYTRMRELQRLGEIRG